MKTLKISAVLLIGICLLSTNHSLGQDMRNDKNHHLTHYNPSTATFDSEPVKSLINKSMMFETSDFNCNCSTDFWTVSSEGIIQLWSINDNTITGGTVVLSGAAEGLAYCGDPDNLTFYSGKNDYGILYYDSNPAWTEIPIPIYLTNNGGYLDNQYYQGVGDGNPFCRILYWLEDDELIMIDSLSNKQYTVADIAVDSLGQAWTFVGTNNTSWIYVYDKTGLVKTYDLFASSYNAYGLAFINNTLYIGFGTSSPTYNGALVPVYIDDNTASLGDPISFPYDFYDLAECNCVGSTGGTGNEEIKASFLNVFPNPANGYFAISSKTPMEQIRFLDISGNVLVEEQISCLYHTLNASEFKNGIYFLEVYTNNSVVRKKVVIEH